MDEDDLLGVELRVMDLRHQLQRAGRGANDGRSGFHGHGPPAREQERFAHGKGAWGIAQTTNLKPKPTTGINILKVSGNHNQVLKIVQNNVQIVVFKD